MTDPLRISGLRTLLLALSLFPATLVAQVPIVDYHQHLFSASAAALVTANPNTPGISARYVIALLDSAGIQHALVLSVAYTWGKASRRPVDNEYEHVKAENDWTPRRSRNIQIGCARFAASIRSSPTRSRNSPAAPEIRSSAMG